MKKILTILTAAAVFVSAAVSASFAAAIRYEKTYKDTPELMLTYETTRRAMNKITLTFSDENGTLYCDGEEYRSGASVKGMMDMDEDSYFIDGKNIKYSLHLIDRRTPPPVPAEMESPDDIMAAYDTYELIDTSKWQISVPSEIYEGEVRSITLKRKQGKPVEAKITSVESGDKTVFTAKKYGSSYQIKGVKKGKTALTVNYKTSTGKTGKLTKKITVTRVRPLKSFRFNDKAISLRKTKNFTNYSSGVTYGRIRLTLNSGWKITDASIAHYNSKKNKTVKKDVSSKTVAEMIRTGQKIKIKKNYDTTYVNYTLKKEGHSIPCRITLGKKAN